MDVKKVMEKVMSDLRYGLSADLTPQEIILYLNLMMVSIEGYLAILEAYVEGEISLGDESDGR